MFKYCVIVCLLFLSYFVDAHDTGVRQHTAIPVFTTPIEYEFLEYIEEQSTQERWLRASSLSSFYQLPSVKSLSIPLVMNLFMVGFDGNGHSGITLHDHDIELWFENIDLQTFIHHVDPFHQAQASPVKYSIITRVVKLSPMVNTVIENTIFASLRQDIPKDYEREGGSHDSGSVFEDENEHFYMDPSVITDILDNLVAELKLENSFSLFILNPKNPLDPYEVYGYRRGFSKEEKVTLHGYKGIVIDGLKDLLKTQGPTDAKQQDQIEYSTEQPYQEERVDEKIAVRSLDLTNESERWSQRFIQKYMTNPEDRMREIEQCGHSVDPMCRMGFFKEDKDIIKYVKRIAKSGTPEQKLYLHNVLTKKSKTEGCLMDAWIGNKRLAFIDLMAGPFEWGNIERLGYKMKDTFPRLPADLDIGNLPDIDGEEIMRDQHNSMEESEEWMKWNTLRQAIMEKMEHEYKEQCTGNDDKEICVSMRERIDSFASNIHSLAGDKFEQHNIEKNPGLTHVDDFMSRLSSVISKTTQSLLIRHLPYHRPLELKKNVIFSVHNIKLDNDLDYVPSEALDMEKLKEEIFKMKNQNQEFTFKFSEVYDQELQVDLKTSIAQCSSKVKSTIPVEDTSLKREVYRVDSERLKVVLFNRRIVQKISNPVTPPAFKVIPVFLVSSSSTVPYLFEGTRSAFNFGDYILVFQSNVTEWVTAERCNGDNIVRDLKNPLQSIITEVFTYYSGVAPQDLIFDESSRLIEENYMWHVGDTPFSFAGNTHTLSKIHLDMVQRNQIVSALTKSIHLVNKELHTLTHIQPSLRLYEVYDMLPNQEIRQVYQKITKTWISTIKDITSHRYAPAFNKSLELFEMSNEFHKIVHTIDINTAIHQCVLIDDDLAASFIDWVVPLTLIADISLVGLIFWTVKNRRDKVKTK